MIETSRTVLIDQLGIFYLVLIEVFICKLLSYHLPGILCAYTNVNNMPNCTIRSVLEQRVNNNPNLQLERYCIIQKHIINFAGRYLTCNYFLSSQYARIIQKLGFPAKFKDFKIQNIVGSCDVKFPIRLEGLAYSHGAFSSYEPELFPGLIYRMKQPKIVLLIFVSGKIVLTGAKVRSHFL
ncbi:hypothetical protein GUJ93_ZPchr0012g20153 [Zizania palustris]|uniref:Uncharacterized protein n=1 Tax=Zizania palustris TaxID=103762 RepID=A0A8J5WQF3_ZIZPA|nr:hypothetical protein GUJ93_ZPchr0012g20153 [Zizania palustris]